MNPLAFRLIPPRTIWCKRLFYHKIVLKRKFSDFNVNLQFLKIKCFLLRGNFHTTTVFSIGRQYRIFYLPCNLNSFKPIWKLWLAYVALYIKCMKICSAWIIKLYVILVKGRNHLFWCWWANRISDVCLC